MLNGEIRNNILKPSELDYTNTNSIQRYTSPISSITPQDSAYFLYNKPENQENSLKMRSNIDFLKRRFGKFLFKKNPKLDALRKTLLKIKKKHKYREKIVIWIHTSQEFKVKEINDY